MILQYITLDDNPVHLDQLNGYLDQVPQCNRLASFNHPVKAYEFLLTNRADIIFMDIEMPELSGIELAKQLNDPPLFVFISSHKEFGVETYEVDAIDYILKPVSLERLLKAFKRIYQLLENKAKASHELKIEASHPNYIFIKENQQFVRIELDELLYAESLNSFVNLYLTNGKKHLVLVGLKSLEEQLPPEQFVRVSRSILVNKNKITSFNSTHIRLNQLSFGIGPTYAAKLQQNLSGLTISRFGD